jgi:hypothetical protein
MVKNILEEFRTNVNSEESKLPTVNNNAESKLSAVANRGESVLLIAFTTESCDSSYCL